MQVRSDEDCDDDLDLVKSKNNTQSNDPEGSPYASHTTHTAHTANSKGQNQNKNKNQDQNQYENENQNPLHASIKQNSRRSTIQFVAIDHHHSHTHGHSDCGDVGLALESADIASSLDSSDVTACKQKKSPSTSTSTTTSTSTSSSSSSCPVLICSNLTGDTSLFVNRILVYHT